MLDKHAPLRKLSLQEEKLKKPWITLNILKSIKYKNKLYRKYIRANDPCRKIIYNVWIPNLGHRHPSWDGIYAALL